jgi:hypothetical protein
VTASLAEQDIWHVMLASDDMKRMNVDQLDDAFRLSLVDSSTPVWKAGMETWRRLGSIAGIEDDVETIAHPVQAVQRSAARRPQPPSAPPPPRPAPRALAATAVNPFGATAPFGTTAPVFSAPKLLAPVYEPAPTYAAPVYAAPALSAPDPYVMPRRRVALPSEVDFRRSSSGVRWGRWLGAFVLLTAAVVGAHQQGWLQQGARQVGLENKFLASERRVTSFIAAKAPLQLHGALARLALLPPSTTSAALLSGSGQRPQTTASTESTKPVAAAAAPTQPTGSQPELKTVSLDSLPVLGKEPAATPQPVPARAARASNHDASPTRSRDAAPARVARRAAEAEEAEPAPKRAKAEAEPAPKRAKAEPALPPASPNEGFLKAAIRQAIIADANKSK